MSATNAGMALTGDWLNVNQLNTTNCIQPWDYGYYHAPATYVTYTTPSPRPIQLSMEEVEKLRKAAKTDDALKAILAKFTAQIEVVVDFK